MKTIAPALLLLLASCGNGTPPPPARVGNGTAPVDTRVMDENKDMAAREEQDIRDWLGRQEAGMNTSGTGLRWKLVHDVPGDTARSGQLAVLNYAVFLLNGDTCYSSAQDGPASFRIEHADVESGLQEGIQHLSVGDSAVLVIPSALAFGLLGDRDKIPMRSTIIYHVGLIALQK
ncbi:MAG: FKBP-type peptidyl-prolyl cis-trans isomerase [Flavobacteriales bacterium]|jgi:FKBP-type peptidyl-prolyl cis-trans isomerase|nr:FKBP-type peptidyl-prolyl cis-trans isomerase [Flavobacteriales bacterium]